MHININFPILFIGNLHLGLLSNIYIGNGYSCQKLELKNAVHISKFHIACPACMGGEPVQWLTRRFTCFNQNLQSNLYRPLHIAPICPEFQKLSQDKILYFVCFIWKINMLGNNILINFLWKNIISISRINKVQYIHLRWLKTV